MSQPEQQRRAYLQAMGIDVWLPRDQQDVELPYAEQAYAAQACAESPDAEIAPSGLDWDALQQCVADCTRCELASSRTQTVFGVGNHNASWLIIGEAPGAEEDRRGEPFVGRAGQLLDQMLQAIGQSRDRVFIANILKCRPPDNRDPKPDEAAACRGYLERQIALVQPKIILAVGKIAAQNLLECNDPVGRMRGKAHALGEIPLVVTYHPAYLLRSPSQKKKAWSDLCLAARLAAESHA